MDEIYDAFERIKKVKSAIRDIQRDGLKVGIKTREDGKVVLYVENTFYHNMDTFKYAEIDCFAENM